MKESHSFNYNNIQLSCLYIHEPKLSSTTNNVMDHIRNRDAHMSPVRVLSLRMTFVMQRNNDTSLGSSQLYNQLLKCQNLADKHRRQLTCPRMLPAMLTVSHVTNSTHHLTFPRHVYGSDLWEIYIGYRHCVPLAAARPNDRDVSISSCLLMRHHGRCLSLLLDRWTCLSQSASRMVHWRPLLVHRRCQKLGLMNRQRGPQGCLYHCYYVRPRPSAQRPSNMCWGK